MDHCTICGTWLGEFGGQFYADALEIAGMGIEDQDLNRKVCGTMDHPFTPCAREAVNRTQSYRRQGVLKEVNFQTERDESAA